MTTIQKTKQSYNKYVDHNPITFFFISSEFATGYHVARKFVILNPNPENYEKLLYRNFAGSSQDFKDGFFHGINTTMAKRYKKDYKHP